MKFIKPIAIIAAFLLTLSCNHGDNKSLEVKELAQNDMISEKKAIGNNAETDQTKMTDDKSGFFKADPGGQQNPQEDKVKQKKPPVTQQAAKPDWDKKIIKTASVNLEVNDYNTYYGSIREKIRSVGGYIAQEDQSQSEYKIENSMIIKVPVDQFDNTVVLLTANVQMINERKISSQDVTMEVVDTKSRMEAKRQVRQRYMDLLGQAKNMEEILNVQSEINGIQEEIESATGRIDYLSHSSVFSTINLTYFQVLNSTAKDPETTKPSFGEKIKDAFRAGWEIVSNLFIVIITIWPLLLGSFFVFLLYKKLRAQKPKQA
jgi:Domain of unknown function (DUF4349)